MSSRFILYNAAIFGCFGLVAAFPSAWTYMLTGLVLIFLLGAMVMSVLKEKDAPLGNYPIR